MVQVVRGVILTEDNDSMLPQPFDDEELEEGSGHANSQGKGTKHARGVWSSGLCDCTGDWCSCLSVWCCFSVTTAQLCTRCDPCLTLVHPKVTGTVPGGEHHPAPIGIWPQVLQRPVPPRIALRAGLHISPSRFHLQLDQLFERATSRRPTRGVRGRGRRTAEIARPQSPRLLGLAVHLPHRLPGPQGHPLALAL